MSKYFMLNIFMLSYIPFLLPENAWATPQFMCLTSVCCFILRTLFMNFQTVRTAL